MNCGRTRLEVIGAVLAILSSTSASAQNLTVQGTITGQGAVSVSGPLTVQGVTMSPQAQVPTGALLPFAGSAAPAGFLLCDGAAVSRSTYAALFTAIGTTYGAGDETTTFNVPDLRGRVPLGTGARARGSTGGEETHVLTEQEMPRHTHIQNPHNHILMYYPYSRAAGSAGVWGLADRSLAPNSNYITSTTATNNETGQNSAHNTMPPFVVLNFIIKT